MMNANDTCKLQRGMGIGGWLTNYKRFNVLPLSQRLVLTIGDFEHFDSYITQSDIDYIASLGLDHIRLGFDQLVLEECPGVYRERILALLDRFVGWCHAAGLTPVLNLHKAIGNYCDIPEDVTLFDSTELQDRFVDLWLALERHFAGAPDVMFELLNEVRGNAADAWNQLAARTLAALRALNPTRTVIIGTANWNSCGDLARLQLHDDPNVIYTWHFYSPFEFTHQQGVLQAAPLFYNRKMPYPGDAERYRDFARTVHHQDNAYSGLKTIDINWMRQATQPAWDFQAQHPDKQVWCGEFGTIRHIRTEYRENWMHDLISLLLEHHTPYCVWNYLSTPNDGNRFSLVDDDHRTIVSPRMAHIIRGQLD